MKIVNKRAYHDYHILETLEAGVELLGSEVKSIRQGRVELGQSLAKLISGQMFLVNANIPQYQNSSPRNYEPSRSRRLLLHKDQILSLVGKTSRSGIVLVPLAIYTKGNLIKVLVGLGKSKKQFDKREVVKERDHKRRIEQELRGKY